MVINKRIIVHLPLGLLAVTYLLPKESIIFQNFNLNTSINVVIVSIQTCRIKAFFKHYSWKRKKKNAIIVRKNSGKKCCLKKET